jgi:UDP-glucose 4-epimerase
MNTTESHQATISPTSLVTGGAGFIGAHVAKQLLQMGHRVIVLDDLSGGYLDNVPGGAQFVEGSILDHQLVDSLFREHKFEYVYHLAAYAAEGLSHFIKRFNYHNNLIGSVNLINAAVNHDAQRFVFTSSIAVYGAGQTPMTEDMIPMPEDSYGIAKLAVEQELKVSHEMFGLEYTIFRPHNVYGELQNIGDRYRNVVGIFMNQLLKGEPMTIFGDGEQERAFTHVNDVAPLIAECIKVPASSKQVFNVGADVPFTVNYLAKAVAAVMGLEERVEHLEARKEVKHAFSDHSKAERVFGKRSKTSLEEGLRSMANWVKTHGARTSGVFQNIEIMQNLPPSWSKALQGQTKGNASNLEGNRSMIDKSDFAVTQVGAKG